MKFKVGDRVAIYTNHGRAVDEIQDITSTGVLLLHTMSAHYKQCRLLKKRDHKRMWVHHMDYKNWQLKAHQLVIFSDPHDSDYIEFVEVHRKVCQA